MGAAAGGAALSSGLSAAATKILAVTLGPAAIALLATLQQVRQTALVASTANGQTALVRGASALEAAERREFLRTVAAVVAVFTLATALSLALAPQAWARWCGLPPAQATLVRPLAAVAALASLFAFQSALLNALGAIRTLAVLQTVGPAAMALAAWPVAVSVRHGHPAAFPVMLALAAGACAAAALEPLARHRHTLAAWFLGRGAWWSWPAASRFFSMAGAMLATGLAASAALVTVRAAILRGQGLEAAGQFDAAWAISMNQAALVLASLQTCYLPALARLKTPRERSLQIGRVLTLAAPAAAGAIVLIAALKPVLLTVLFSSAFQPAARYLRWTLLGDYLKVASWILSVPMLAAADMKVFVVADLSAVAAFTGSALALKIWWSPAESAAIAFVLMHVVHLAIGAAYVVRQHGFRLWSRPTAVWTGGLAVVGAVSAVFW